MGITSFIWHCVITFALDIAKMAFKPLRLLTKL